MRIENQNISAIQQKKSVHKKDIRIPIEKLCPPSSNKANSNIAYIETRENYGLKKIIFSKPLHVSDALNTLANTNIPLLKERLLYKMHTEETMSEMANDLKNIKTLEKEKVTKLYSAGAFALVFETKDGKILKITQHNHFPHGRKPAWFDLPILKQGKHNYTHYYLEEKADQSNLSQDELRQLVKSIKNKGYTMKDYLLRFSYENEADDIEETIKTEQFGRASDGKIYLIDPGCAIAPPKHFFNPKTIKDKIWKMFNEKYE